MIAIVKDGQSLSLRLYCLGEVSVIDKICALTVAQFGSIQKACTVSWLQESWFEIDITHTHFCICT